ncbi:MAG: hypothetical protein Kow0010_04560 [Dehalococcoidia bacterium]
MYTIVSERRRARITIELSGRVSTAEALRATSQAAAMARADDLDRFLCDLRAVERGPGGLVEVAAAIAVHLRPGMRVAFVACDRQRPVVRRLVRFCGSPMAMYVAETRQAATRWLQSRRSRRPVRPPTKPEPATTASARAESAA